MTDYSVVRSTLTTIVYAIDRDTFANSATWDHVYAATSARVSDRTGFASARVTGETLNLILDFDPSIDDAR